MVYVLNWMNAESGVLQSTVLGPVHILTFVSDFPKAAHHSKIRLFVDDCVLYKKLAKETDCDLLQEASQHLEVCEQKWSMDFNTRKCNSINITRKMFVTTLVLSIPKSLKNLPNK